MVEKQPLTEETLAAKPGAFHLCPLFWLVFLQVPAMGMLGTKGSTWSAYLHVNFQNASPTFPHTIVMLLYLFCLGTNRGEGPEVGQHSVLALPWLSLCPTGWKPDCYFSLAPQISSAAVQSWEVFSGLWGLKQAGTWPWECSCPGSQALCSDSGGSPVISICLVPTIFFL